MKALLIAGPYLLAALLFAATGHEVFWPFLIACSVIVAWWDTRASLVLLAGVVLVQIPKVDVDPLYQWVYWAAIYIAMGVLTAPKFSKIGGITAICVGGMYLTYYLPGVTAFAAHLLAEVAFVAGAVVAGYRGDGGLGAVFKPSPVAAGYGSGALGSRRHLPGGFGVAGASGGGSNALGDDPVYSREDSKMTRG